ncbi:trimeric intracellular cation channel family protein [Rhodopseudomonas palustris]|uniref:trimeric intracellular cation channel family protein n=1 Tax=Rhodopseudomonas palustris TaxID=1076 RepID=UPI0020CB771A|nr:trimeric intracellular cation channel family protein [Rhodopseudomonas palustris]MCP9629652.1 trimeric intracellular cation channel family protein [Rhodopseudomonas palustris]
MFETVTTLLDWLGIVVFAVTGALVASRKEMDIVGFALLGTATGIGGGTLRDVLLGLPVFWVHEPAYLVTCVVIACVAFFTAHIPHSRYKALLWLDAVGMALFAVSGAEKAALAGANGIVAVAMGVVTATFGGIIRDLLGGEIPVILRREIYVTAALLGAATFVALMSVGTPRELSLVAGFALALLIRAAALWRGWSLPRYRPRPGQSDN